MENRFAIMFADVAGSTKLYDTLGNAEAERLISWCVQSMTAITEQYGGHVIKTIGDEIMASFPAADNATEAAVEMQHKISDDDSNALNIRIGMQYGEAIERDGDLFGDAVNVAARMAGVAKAQQIITTEDLVAALSPALVSKSRLFDSATVKGKNAELKIHQIVWEEENSVTQFARPMDVVKDTTQPRDITLHYNGEETRYSSSGFGSPISIGRDDSCSIALNAKFASRSHVNLECRRGKFVLIDHSTNGTYVKFDGSDDIFIRREELTLMGNGIISLGEGVNPDSPSVIRFSIH